MATLLDGRRLAGEIEARLKAVIARHGTQLGRPPGLAVLRVGDDPASGVYVANKEKACARVGITSLGAHLAAGTGAEEVLAAVRRLNADPCCDGILLQLPLPPLQLQALQQQARPGQQAQRARCCHLLW